MWLMILLLAHRTLSLHRSMIQVRHLTIVQAVLTTVRRLLPIVEAVLQAGMTDMILDADVIVFAMIVSGGVLAIVALVMNWGPRV